MRGRRAGECSAGTLIDQVRASSLSARNVVFKREGVEPIEVWPRSDLAGRADESLSARTGEFEGGV